MKRRAFLAGALAAGASLGMSRRAPRVLLRSSWQTINIGDIAHTPGMLALLEKHWPEAEVTLWPNALSKEVEALLRRRFPKLKIGEGEEAIRSCDVALHGSGPGLVGAAAMKAFAKTGKPYGFGGVTLSDAELKNERELLEKAAFIFCRDSASLEAAKLPNARFGPDATFCLDLRDDARAEGFLKEKGLDAFACFVPRLRWTPYWKEGRKVAAETVAKRHAENEAHREADHAKLRAAVVAWVRAGGKALLCPEMTYQVELLKPFLFDPLPDDVKPGVVLRPGYWLTDEAASTYARATAVASLEMHSPIIAVANGVPALHLRQPTDTRKGQMWRDVGLAGWLFEIDASSGEEIAARMLTLREKGARDVAAKARAFAAEKGKAMIEALKAAAG